MSTDFSPKLNAAIFECWHCHGPTQHHWPRVALGQMWSQALAVSTCVVCGNITVWYDGRLVYPHPLTVAPPNPDLAPSIQADYEEAAAILWKSPRGAAALLRLCIQKLCVQLGEKGKRIDDDIASLVQKGLDVRIQKALDIVRVIGNESVHPGSIDLRDTPEVARELFRLVNMIADHMITRPREIDALYASLPAAKLKGIEDRDSKLST